MIRPFAVMLAVIFMLFLSGTQDVKAERKFRGQNSAYTEEYSAGQEDVQAAEVDWDKVFVKGAEKRMAGGSTGYPVKMDRLPQNLKDLESMEEGALRDPHMTAALVVAALARYPKNKDDAIAMLNFLMGPGELSNYDKQFLRDRFFDKDYVPRSYYEGATPENDYQPSVPYSIVIIETPYSRDNESQGYLKLYVKSGGADSPRPIELRQKKSTGEWFLTQQMLLGGIRVPASTDPWN